MDLFLIVAALSTVSGSVAAAVKIRKSKGKAVTLYRPLTKAEAFMETRELSHWLVQDAKQLTEKISANPEPTDANDLRLRKEAVTGLLRKFSALVEHSTLSNLSKAEARRAIEAADIAAQVTHTIDRKFMLLLTLMIERTVEGILASAGTKETAMQMLAFAQSIGGFPNAFKKYASWTPFNPEGL